MDLGFLDVFPGIGFQNKVRFSGFDQVSTGFGSFLRTFSFLRTLDKTQMIHSKDKVKIDSTDRIGFFG